MPLYEYLCTACGRLTEKRQKFSDPEITDCPYCGGKLERTITAPAIQFKGGGWYADGYGLKPKAAASGSGDSSPAGEAKSGGESTKSSGESSGTTTAPSAPAASTASAPASAPSSTPST